MFTLQTSSPKVTEVNRGRARKNSIEMLEYYSILAYARLRYNHSRVRQPIPNRVARQSLVLIVKRLLSKLRS